SGRSTPRTDYSTTFSVPAMRRKRDFLIVATLITTWLALAQPPRVGMADHWGASWKAGWPMGFESWVEGPDGVNSSYRFSPLGLLIDVVVWFVLIVAVWF